MRTFAVLILFVALSQAYVVKRESEPHFMKDHELGEMLFERICKKVEDHEFMPFVTKLQAVAEGSGSDDEDDERGSLIKDVIARCTSETEDGDDESEERRRQEGGKMYRPVCMILQKVAECMAQGKEKCLAKLEDVCEQRHGDYGEEEEEEEEEEEGEEEENELGEMIFERICNKVLSHDFGSKLEEFAEKHGDDDRRRKFVKIVIEKCRSGEIPARVCKVLKKIGQCIAEGRECLERLQEKCEERGYGDRGEGIKEMIIERICNKVLSPDFGSKVQEFAEKHGGDDGQRRKFVEMLMAKCKSGEIPARVCMGLKKIGQCIAEGKECLEKLQEKCEEYKYGHGEEGEGKGEGSFAPGEHHPKCVPCCKPHPPRPRPTKRPHPTGEPSKWTRPSGPHPSGPHPSGPHPSGPHPSGPHPSGPRPSGKPTSKKSTTEIPITMV